MTIRSVFALLVSAALLIAVGCGGESAVVTVTTSPPARTTVETGGGETSGPATSTVATTLSPPSATTAPPAQTGDTGSETVERPADFPNGGEAFVLERVNADIGRRCTREDPGTRARGSVAGLYCDAENALGATIYYNLFPTVARMEASYNRYRNTNDVPLGTNGCLREPGGELRPLPGENTWHLERTPDRTEGRALCFRDGDRVWLIMSYDSTRIITFISARNRGAVLDVVRIALPTAG